MKNKKLLKMIAATIVCSAMGISAFSFAACDPSESGNDGTDGNDVDTGHKHSYTWVDDENGTTHHEHCTVDGCDTPDKTSVNHVDSDEDETCDDCGANLHKHSYSDVWSVDINKHWHVATCDHTDSIADEEEHDLDDSGKCSVCEALIAKYEFLASDYETSTKLSKDIVSSIFTICAGTAIRSRTKENVYIEGDKVLDVVYTQSIQMASSDAKIIINAPAPGELVLHVQNGSSVARQQLNLKSPDEKVTPIVYSGNDHSSMTQLVRIALPETGEYELTRPTGTSDIYYMSFTAVVDDTPIEKIEVGAKGAVNYFVGQEISYAGLAVNAIHEDTGRVSPILTSALNITSNYDKTTPGTYTVNISYTVDGQTFETSYQVTVYALSEVKLGTDKIIKSNSNTSAGNGVYENHTLRQLYFVNENVSDDGLSVILGGGEGEDTQDFLLKSGEYSLSEVDMSTPGKKTVIVSVESNGTTVSATFDIYVIAKDADLATATSVDIAVDGATTEANIGVKNGAGAYQFKTIHQALEFLEHSGVKASATKTINLAAGNYWEKLEVKVPNLTIVGAGRDTTTIEYDSLYGIKDAGGFEHTTDSTATLNVREAAVNFTIKDVTVSNWYNSIAHFDQALGANYPEHRALALLVQSDKFIMDNCKLLGYQDTVELFTGRQYILNTYIEGTTDFIFGTNNTTYFYNCQIHSISNGKRDGGYITAFKGNNKDKDDYVTYGAIFDHCNFTADAGVLKKGDQIKDGNNNVIGYEPTGNTSIGRCWGAYSAVAVINSEIGGHVSINGFSGDNKNQRYVSMNAKPSDSTVKFVEYNNTGDGKVTSEVGGMRLLSETEAANYSDFTKIFGTTNGGVKYTSAWIPVIPGTEAHSITVVIKGGEELGDFTVADGAAVVVDQIKALLLESATYNEYEIKGVYSNPECTTEYTYPNVSGNDTIYIEIEKTKVSINLKDETLPNGDCVAAINEKYGDSITWTGTGNIQTDKTNPDAFKPQNGVKIGTDTVITVNVVGEVNLIKGYELPESDYVITYKDGKATIKFVAATGTYGTYLGGIDVDLTTTPEDSVFYTVTFDYNDDVTEPVVKDDVVSGSKVLKPTDPKRAGYTFEYWYAGSDENTPYDFDTATVTGNVTLTAKWTAGEKEYQTITSATSAQDAKLSRNGEGKLVGNEDYFNVEGTWHNNNGHPQFREGAKISFYVTAGAHIDMEAYYSFGNGYVYTVKAVAEGKDFAAQTMQTTAAEKEGAHIIFDVEDILVDAGGNDVDVTGVERIRIEITATVGSHCQSVTVTYPAA